MRGQILEFFQKETLHETSGWTVEELEDATERLASDASRKLLHALSFFPRCLPHGLVISFVVAIFSLRSRSYLFILQFCLRNFNIFFSSGVTFFPSWYRYFFRGRYNNTTRKKKTREKHERR